jgi:hypothetical protein
VIDLAAARRILADRIVDAGVPWPVVTDPALAVPRASSSSRPTSCAPP